MFNGTLQFVHTIVLKGGISGSVSLSPSVMAGQCQGPCGFRTTAVVKSHGAVWANAAKVPQIQHAFDLELIFGHSFFTKSFLLPKFLFLLKLNWGGGMFAAVHIKIKGQCLRVHSPLSGVELRSSGLRLAQQALLLTETSCWPLSKLPGFPTANCMTCCYTHRLRDCVSYKLFLKVL